MPVQISPQSPSKELLNSQFPVLSSCGNSQVPHAQNTLYTSAKRKTKPTKKPKENPLLLSIFNNLTAPNAAQTGLGSAKGAFEDARGDQDCLCNHCAVIPVCCSVGTENRPLPLLWLLPSCSTSQQKVESSLMQM